MPNSALAKVRLSPDSLDIMPFHPAKWAKDGHMQTILGDVLPSPALRDKGEKWLVDLEEKNKLVCRLHLGKSDWAIVIGHGLTGNSDAGYIQRQTARLIADGHTVVRMNHRNCGEGLGLAVGAYHAGSSDDLARIVFEIKKLRPGIKVACIGFSLSGNATLLLAAGVYPSLANSLEKMSSPDLVISVCPPVHLADATERFVRGFNRVYQWNFMRDYKRLDVELKKRGLLEENIIHSTFMTIREVDEIYTSRRAGFSSADLFYEKCSAAFYFDQIKIPTWILASHDDPIVNSKPLEQARDSAKLKVMIESNGGHMGFIANSKTPFGDNRWMDYAVKEIFDSAIKTI